MYTLRYGKKFRLKIYDYSQNGYYIVTICTKYRYEWFGKIKNGEMILSKIGKIAKKCWLEIPEHYPNVKLDKAEFRAPTTHQPISTYNSMFIGINYSWVQNRGNKMVSKQ